MLNAENVIFRQGVSLIHFMNLIFILSLIPQRYLLGLFELFNFKGKNMKYMPERHHPFPKYVFNSNLIVCLALCLCSESPDTRAISRQ